MVTERDHSLQNTLPELESGSSDHRILILASADISLMLVNRLDHDAEGILIDSTTNVDRGLAILDHQHIDCVIVADTELQAGSWNDALRELGRKDTNTPIITLVERADAIVDTEVLQTDINTVLLLSEAIQPNILATAVEQAISNTRCRLVEARLSDLSSVVADLVVNLHTADSFTAIAQIVCNQLVSTQCYNRVWLCAYEADSETFSIVAAAGMLPVEGIRTLNRDFGHRIKHVLQTGEPVSASMDPLSTDYLFPLIKQQSSEQPRKNAVVIVSVDRDISVSMDEIFHLEQIAQIAGHRLQSILEEATIDQQRMALETMTWQLTAMPAGLLVFNSNGVIIGANRAAGTLLERPVTSLPGTSIWEVTNICDAVSIDDYWSAIDVGNVSRRTVSLVTPEGRKRLASTLLVKLPSVPLITEMGTVGEIVAPPQSATNDDSVIVSLLVDEAEPTEEELSFAEIVSYEIDQWVKQAHRGIKLARTRGERYHFKQVDRALMRISDTVQTELANPSGSLVVSDTEQLQLHTIARIAWQHIDDGTGDLYVLDDVKAIGDYLLVLKLFEQLFRNARDHSDTRVTVRVESIDNGVAIEDDGPGIPTIDRTRIFESGVAGGDNRSGLGLAIVKRIVDAHGWNIRVRRGRNGGARFEITGFDDSNLN